MKTKHCVIISTFFIISLLFAGVEKCEAASPTMTYHGTAFFKIKTSEGIVIYIDPYQVTDPEPADIVLITHEHSDHNELWRLTLKPNCQVIRSAQCIQGTNYQKTFVIGDVIIRSVAAYGDAWHQPYTGVGFIVEFDSIKVYHGGGTSFIPEMSELTSQNITYALLTLVPGAEIMSQAAAVIQAKYDIPCHTTDIATLTQFTSPHRMILRLNATIELTKDTAGTILRVPQDYSTIQAAIDAAYNLDTILVSEGTYHENLNYRGKGIVVTSRYFMTKDWQTILNTIIDGSTALDKTNGSVVQFLFREDSTAVLDGFTITGGNGSLAPGPFTAWFFYGAGIYLYRSSAIIRNNYIVNNIIMNPAGPPVSQEGGGGILAMLSSPTIINNVIAFNKARYAGGIILDFSGGKVRNNIVYHNYATAEGSDGGGGIECWVVPANSTFVENNTIICNISATHGGGINITYHGGTDIPMPNEGLPITSNNIIWGNRQATGGQISNPQYITGYNNVEDYSSGTNISVYPQLQDGSFSLSSTSPCIDAGDPSSAYNDIEDPSNLGMALLPSRGILRNDIGAFGGAMAKTLTSIDISDIYVSNNSISVQCSTGCQTTSGVKLANISSKSITIDSVTHTDTMRFSLNKNFAGQVFGMLGSDSIKLTFHPTERAYYSDTISVFHKIAGKTNPIKIVVSASSNSAPHLNKAIPNQTAYTGVLFTYPIPDSTFLDPDIGDTLMYQASGLPSWLSFNTQTHTFQGTPTQTVRLVSIGITVNDLLLASASTILRMTVVTPTTGVDNSPTSPTQYELRQNYPNPFNPTTNIRFEIVDLEFVSLKIFDVLGREVATLMNEEKPKGNYNVTWDASHMPSGVYFYRLVAENFSQVKRMLLIK